MENLRPSREIVSGASSERTPELIRTPTPKGSSYIERWTPLLNRVIRRDIELHPANGLETLPKPDLVLNQVANAAEHNLAIEKHYERRHETKDEPSALLPKAVSIGQLLAAKEPLRPPDPPPANSNDLQPLTSISKANPYRMGQGLYKKAIIRGFSVAILLLMLAMVIFIIGIGN